MPHPAPFPSTLPPECLPLARYRKGDEEYVVLATLDGSAGPRAVCHAVRSDVVVTFLAAAFYGNAALELARLSPAPEANAEIERLRNEVARLERDLATVREHRAEAFRQIDAVLRACSYPGSHQHDVAGEAPVAKVKRALERIARDRDAASTRAADRERERDTAQAQRDGIRAHCDALQAHIVGLERERRAVLEVESERDALGAELAHAQAQSRRAFAAADAAEKERDALQTSLRAALDVERELRESLARERSERDAAWSVLSRNPLSEREAIAILDASSGRRGEALNLLGIAGRHSPGPYAVEDVRLAALAHGASACAVDAALRLFGRSL